jgi:acyl-CoA reductase-like NAD-dependent aldehyde dehydrogenase
MAVTEEQELFFEAVYADPEMTDAQKAKWLYESAKEYWQRLEWEAIRYEARDAVATAWAEQATKNAGDLHELRMRVEEADALARKDEDADGFITAYHFNTGAWHRLLAEVRK